MVGLFIAIMEAAFVSLEATAELMPENRFFSSFSFAEGFDDADAAEVLPYDADQLVHIVLNGVIQGDALF